MSRAQICPLLLSVSLSFAGCASYSGIQGEAQALAPQSLAFHQDRTGGDWPREDWWTRFGDPKLDALMPQALQGNPSLRAAEARVRVAVPEPRPRSRRDPRAPQPERHLSAAVRRELGQSGSHCARFQL